MNDGITLVVLLALWACLAIGWPLARMLHRHRQHKRYRQTWNAYLSAFRDRQRRRQDTPGGDLEAELPPGIEWGPLISAERQPHRLICGEGAELLH